MAQHAAALARNGFAQERAYVEALAGAADMVATLEGPLTLADF